MIISRVEHTLQKPLIILWKIAWFWLGASPTLPLLFPDSLYWVSATIAVSNVALGLFFLTFSALNRSSSRKPRLFRWVIFYFIWVMLASALSNYTWHNPFRVWGFLLSSLAWILIAFSGVRGLASEKYAVLAAGYYIFGVILTTAFLLLLGRETSERFGNEGLLHPNSLGFMYGIAWLSVMFLPIFRPISRLILQTSFGILLILVFSKTSLIAALAAYLMGLTFQAGWQRIKIIVPAGIIAGLAGANLVDYVDHQLQAYLNSPTLLTTLTGRTVLWSWVIEMVRERPWIGYGFASFRDTFAPYSWAYGFSVPAAQAHNAFLDALFMGGYIGLLLFLIIVIKSMTSILGLSFRIKGTNFAAYFVAVMSFLLIRALVEGTLNLGRDFTIYTYLGLLTERLSFMLQRNDYEISSRPQLLPTARR